MAINNTANNTVSLREKTHGDAIWDGKHKNPLVTSKCEYETARKLCWSIQFNWSEFSDSFFGTSSLSAFAEFENIKQDFVNKGMTYASTLFGAINSPYNLFKAYAMQLELREVVCELEKLGSNYYSPSQKEVMIAFLMKLRDGLRGSDANKEYYGACATKYVSQLLANTNTPSATRMLTLARATTITSIALDLRLDYEEEVVHFLSKVRNEPTKIHQLAQDWKTYVRLARMIFAWKYMFFGLRHDRSKDLHVKSYVFFVLNCYK